MSYIQSFNYSNSSTFDLSSMQDVRLERNLIPVASQPSTVEPEISKTHKRVLRNRANAQLSRDRKKKYLEEIEEKVKVLETKNRILERRVHVLEGEKSYLLQVLAEQQIPISTDFISVPNDMSSLTSTPSSKVSESPLSSPPHFTTTSSHVQQVLEDHLEQMTSFTDNLNNFSSELMESISSDSNSDTDSQSQSNENLSLELMEDLTSLVEQINTPSHELIQQLTQTEQNVQNEQMLSSSEVSETESIESIEDDMTDSIFSSFIDSLTTTPNETPQNETNFESWVNQPLENNDISTTTTPHQNIPDFDFEVAPIEQENDDALFFDPQNALQNDDDINGVGGLQNDQDQNHEIQLNETPPLQQNFLLQQGENIAQANPQELQPNNDIQLQFDGGAQHILQFDQTDNENHQPDGQLQFDQLDQLQTNQIVIQVNGPPLINNQASALQFQLSQTQQNQTNQSNRNYVQQQRQQQQPRLRQQTNEVNDQLQRQTAQSIRDLSNQNQVTEQSQLDQLVSQDYLGSERELDIQQRQQLQDENIQSQRSRMLQILSNVVFVNNNLDEFVVGERDQNGRQWRIRGVSNQFVAENIIPQESSKPQNEKQKNLAGKYRNVGQHFFDSLQDGTSLLDPKILSKIKSLTQAIEVFDGNNQVFRNLQLPSQYSLFQYMFSNISQIFNLFTSFIVGVVSNQLTAVAIQ